MARASGWFSAITHSPGCILMLSKLRRQPKPPARRVASGKCTISYSKIRPLFKAKIFINIPISLGWTPRGSAGTLKIRLMRRECAKIPTRRRERSYATPGLFINGVRYSGGLDLISILNRLKQGSERATS